MDLIKENKIIRDALLKRWKELDIKYDATIIKDAEERGMHFTKAVISSYRNHCKGLTQTQIIWLCFRYGIKIAISIGEPVYNKGKDAIEYLIYPYNEIECIKNLNKYKKLFK